MKYFKDGHHVVINVVKCIQRLVRFDNFLVLLGHWGPTIFHNYHYHNYFLMSLKQRRSTSILLKVFEMWLKNNRDQLATERVAVLFYTLLKCKMNQSFPHSAHLNKNWLKTTSNSPLVLSFEFNTCRDRKWDSVVSAKRQFGGIYWPSCS